MTNHHTYSVCECPLIRQGWVRERQYWNLAGLRLPMEYLYRSPYDRNLYPLVAAAKKEAMARLIRAVCQRVGKYLTRRMEPADVDFQTLLGIGA